MEKLWGKCGIADDEPLPLKGGGVGRGAIFLSASEW